MAEEIKTPITDKEANELSESSADSWQKWFSFMELCRQLERELTLATQERDDLRKACMKHYDENNYLVLDDTYEECSCPICELVRALKKTELHELYQSLLDAAPSPPAPAKDGMSERIYLNGYQIKQLAAMVDDDDECELVLAKFPDAEDVETKEKMPAGLYAWYCDYPDEGRTYLPDSAAYEGKD